MSCTDVSECGFVLNPFRRSIDSGFSAQVRIKRARRDDDFIFVLMVIDKEATKNIPSYTADI